MDIEGSFIHGDRKDGKRDVDFGRFAVGFEIKIADNLWLDFSVGGETKQNGMERQVFALSSISFAFAGSRQLGAMPEPGGIAP